MIEVIWKKRNWSKMAVIKLTRTHVLSHNKETKGTPEHAENRMRRRREFIHGMKIRNRISEQ